jgi:hypothetical protein
MHAFIRCLAVAATGAALCAPVTTSIAAEQGVTCSGLGYAQRRVLENAYQGVDALRRYVIITRSVHQMSMADVVESLDDWRAKANCTKDIAADASAPAVTAVAQARH